MRLVEVGNGLYPQDWLAKRFGTSADDLAKTFRGGVNVDYTDSQTRGAHVAAALSAGSELHIKDAGGADLKVKVQGRPYGYFVSLPGTTVTLDGKPVVEAGQ